MPISEISKHSTNNISILDIEGNVDLELMPQVSNELIKEMYEKMVLLRTMDKRLFTLQRAGKIGTYAQTLGQEASEIASAIALEKQDWFVPSFREMGVYLVRGADLGALVQGWKGDTRAFANKDNSPNMPIAIPIASQCQHAVGIAWASKIKKEKAATIVYFGEGATAEGDFHEAMNFAATMNLPVVFFCQRNGWSISTPTHKESSSKSIAQKAYAYEMNGIQVDGNDVFAVYKATKEALERAKNGEGPTLIESVTYRMGDHTTSDDSHKYRTVEEEEEWKKKDPIDRLLKYILKNNICDNNYESWVLENSTKLTDEAVEKGLNVEAPNPSQLFDDVYSKKPWMLIEQEEQLMKELEDIKNNGGGN